MPSRVGKRPIEIPAGVQVNREGNTVRVKGPKGELSFKIGHGVEVQVDPKAVVVTQVGGGKQALALHGTTRASSPTWSQGDAGFTGAGDQGTGYRAQLSGKAVLARLLPSDRVRGPGDLDRRSPTPA
jgi:large subunit ribosomal protein L6